MKILPVNRKLVFLFMSVPLFVFAQDPELCSDLASFACAPGEYNDGTGVAVNGMFNSSNYSAKVLEDAVSSLQSKFKDLIEDPSNSYFRNTAITGLSLSAAPECRSTAADAVRKCNSSLVDGLVAIAKSRVFGANSGGGSGNAPQHRQVKENLEKLSMVFGNDQFVKVVNSVLNDADRKVEDPRVEQKIRNKMIPKLKDLLSRKLESLPIEQSKKEFMISKIRAITFSGTDCDESNKGLSRHFIPNAFYDGIKNTLKICRGLLRENVSEFHVATVVLHELAHAIDPCCLSKGAGEAVIKHRDTSNLAVMDSEYPLPDLVSCLRSPKSVQAKNANQSFSLGSAYAMSQGGQFGSPPVLDHCSDQIGESTSDWFAAEILPEYIQQAHPRLNAEQWRMGASNIFRPICNFSEDGKFDKHPHIFDRLNRVFLQNPKLRQKMKCAGKDPERIYCDATPATANRPPAMAPTGGIGGAFGQPVVVDPHPPRAPRPSSPPPAGTGRVAQ